MSIGIVIPYRICLPFYCSIQLSALNGRSRHRKHHQTLFNNRFSVRDTPSFSFKVIHRPLTIKGKTRSQTLKLLWCSLYSLSPTLYDVCNLPLSVISHLSNADALFSITPINDFCLACPMLNLLYHKCEPTLGEPKYNTHQSPY